MDKIIFYSNGSDELCYDLEYWENELDEFLSEEENTIDFIELEEMKYDKHKYATKWCTLHQEFLDGVFKGRM
jgi:glutaredoxin-related protein